MSRRLLIPLLLLAALPAAAQPSPGGGLAFGALPLDAEAGAALFRKTWVSGPASTRASDGLGPRYNARSCERCHPRGGAGFPVEEGRAGLAAPALVLFFPEGSARYGAQLQTFAVPGLPAKGRLSLRYEERPVVLADGEIVTLREPQYQVEALAEGPLEPGLRLSPRLAPALAGAALLAALPDERLGMDMQAEDGAPRPTGRLGWQASASSLAEQVALALHRDLGLGNPLFPDPAGDCGSAQPGCGADRSLQSQAAADPSGDCGSGRAACASDGGAGKARLKDGAEDCGPASAACRPGGAEHPTLAGTAEPLELEAGEAVLDALLLYLEHLRPARHVPPAAGSEAERGSALFEEIGCAGCHRPELEAAPGLRPFSDLRLHDLGEGLADRDTDGRSLPTAWRTAPLWGLAQRAGRWLHDGRAGSLDEAILWHAGEAGDAAQRYRGLPAAERAALRAFLEGL